MNGCQATAVTFVQGDFNLPTVSATSPTITCSVPSVAIASTANPATVTFKWAGPGINAGNQSVQNPQVTTAGNYSVTVTATNGCTSTTTVTVPADVTPPNISVAGVTLTCTQPSSTITGASSTPGVTYAWAGPNGFTATVPSPTISVPGDYTLTVTAPNGCTSTNVATATPDSNAPSATAAAGTLTCAVTSLPLAGTSNLATVTWQWNGPGGFSSTQQNPTVNTPGVYTLVITNPQNGCTDSATATVAADVQGPHVSLAIPAQLNCTVTQVSLSATVQTPGSYTYEWTTPDGTILSGAQSPVPTVGSAGTYWVEVINLQNGCASEQSVAVTVDSSTVTGAELLVRHISCFGRTDGGLNVPAVIGGTPPYLYSLDNGPFSAQSVFSALPPGTHTLAIQDANGCEWETTFEVIEPEELIVELGPDVTVNFGHTISLTLDNTVNLPDRVVDVELDPT